MTRSITRTIARLTAATAGVIAVGGAVSDAAGGEPTTACRTWHLRITEVSAQHTWHPGDTIDVPQDPWDPSAAPGAGDAGPQDPWRPGGAGDPGPQHAWHPTGTTTGLPAHSWHPDGERSAACP